MKISILLAVPALFAACAMPQGAMKRGAGEPGGAAAQPAQQQYSVDETVDIVTDPPGAKIFVNDAFVGYAPVKADVRRTWRGDPRYQMTLDNVKIEARPVEAGQCAQSGIFGQGSVKSPPQVRFNMSSCAAAAPVRARRKK
ncbi:MAG: hypothetical protein NTY45_02865 [Elusimicrobia bacterium]|nr:hypothetical protein [Elusimicrobiota bacterium]